MRRDVTPLQGTLYRALESLDCRLGILDRGPDLDPRFELRLEVGD